MSEIHSNPITEENIIDEDVLHSLSEAIGKGAMVDFLNRFLDDCVVRTKKITQAYENGDFKDVEIEAHTLGTSAATYGALHLEKACREIEYSQPIKGDSFQKLIEDLNSFSEKSLKSLRTYTS